VKLALELTRTGPGEVTGRIFDTEDGDYKIYEVVVATTNTQESQTRVLKDLARHLNWFVDLSEGGTQ
jgi:hypothetical protein